MNTTTEPLTIGPFKVGADGRLRLRNAEVAPALTYRWMGRPVRAEIAGQRLHLIAHAGRIPSSATHAAAQREACLRAARAMPALMPHGWTARLASDHRLVIRTDAPIGPSIGIRELLATLTAFAINVTPYLSALEENGIA